METATLMQKSLEEKILQLENKLAELKKQQEIQDKDNSVSIICFSGEWDKLFAALTIASGSLALGMNVNLFFTFWALSALKKKEKASNVKRNWVQKVFNSLLPNSFSHTPLSKFNMMGLSKIFMKSLMKEKGVDDIDVLFEEVKDMGARIFVCDTSAQLFGINCQELNADNLEVCGSTTFIAEAKKSKITLFI